MTDAETRPEGRFEPSILSRGRQFHYAVYGLSVASEIELPELVATDGIPCADADVEIVMAASEPLDATVEELADGLCVRGRTAQFLVDGLARYTIVDGRRILIERLASSTGQPADEADVRLFALGSAMGALLYQRGILPLHVSAVTTPQGTWAFTGQSGAGKSTLAAWLNTYCGQSLVTDDVLAAHPQEDGFTFYPGPARAKLWTDALGALGMGTDGLTRDYSRADKFQMPVATLGTGPCPPLQGLLVLERAEDDGLPSLTPVNGADVFQAMLAALYRPTFALRILPRKTLFAQAMRLARQVPVHRFRRRASLVDMNTSIAPLLRQMGVVSSARTGT